MNDKAIIHKIDDATLQALRDIVASQLRQFANLLGKETVDDSVILEEARRITNVLVLGSALTEDCYAALVHDTISTADRLTGNQLPRLH